MADTIYYVDKHDNPTGDIAEKYSAHSSDTKMHAAFSCYVFQNDGKFLVTKRADIKKVWPSVWTNSVCGHPAPHESREDAIHRRLSEELGMQAGEVEVILPKYIYKTPPYKGIIENEFCPVFIAKADMDPVPNPDEVSDWKWMTWDEYVSALESDSNDYENGGENSEAEWSWWCKDQLKQLKDNENFQKLLASF